MGTTMVDYGAVTGLVASLWRAMDLGRHDDVLALLTDDCRWYRDGGWQEGAAAIRASMDRRPTDRVVRHILSNFIVDAGEDSASCAYYLLAYEGAGEKTTKPKELGAALAMADMTTTVVVAGGALQIAEIGMDITFLRSPTA